jgi:D-alanyl-D-alanine carboxypeptidase/D-alanyl-D-alanine-endopeptidase (penicillin-binding protein 4)
MLLSGCAIFQPTGRPSNPLEALRYDIEQILSDSIFTPSQVSIKVVSLANKEILFERGSKLLMRPASNMKLLTSSAALHYLGTSHEFRTSLLADTAPLDSVLPGNLFLKGYGDPDLTTADLDTLALKVRLQGVKSIRGGVVVDGSYFDDLYWGNGWNWDDEPSAYAAFISPLAVDDNCVRVTVTPGEKAGDSATVLIEPTTSFVSFFNKATTTDDSVSHPLGVTRLYKEHLNTILVEGEVKKGANPAERQISVWKPELYAATLLHEALLRQGITVQNGPIVGIAPPRAFELASHTGNLRPVLLNLNKTSDNLTAEMLLKTISAVAGYTPGSAAGGVYAVNRFLSTVGIDTSKYFIADGSGLSFYNLLTADMIVQLLEGMTQQVDLFPTFFESLPVAGVDGTLRNRMRRTPAEGNLRAKTGTISGVSSLSGYVETADREKLAFSMTMQNFIYPTRLYQRAQDKIGSLLAGFSRRGQNAHP